MRNGWPSKRGPTIFALINIQIFNIPILPVLENKPVFPTNTLSEHSKYEYSQFPEA